MHRRRDRRVIFHSDSSRSAYIAEIDALKRLLGGKVYGWCLMPNHAHVIFDPGDRAENMYVFLSALASLSGRSSPLYRRHCIPASVLGAHFNVVPIRSDQYLLACAAYVDRNPIEVRLKGRAEDYFWSSYRARIGLSHSSCLDPHPCFERLGATAKEQQQEYRNLVARADGSIWPGAHDLLW